MAKIVTIYLSDEEARELKTFCEENTCTQYSALKTAVKQLLFKSVLLEEDGPEEPLEEPQDTLEESEENITGDDEIEDDVLKNDEDIELVPDHETPLSKYLRRLKNQ